ncbi:uncharacterized protein K444DRAFT_618363 [Hyaloscypha bicolor E]|uniref:Uncharacterized protein n=1 Tax=Hyaloscypha bicolor E TaxID=1095630 RepID=A0A2J6ST11_9HELO|nr:uncharacterized protein K444DRAFT_618363 [Hyaloscypha bicolor E]PMD53892.1 hypothetical protein K444DRAFT_618363 [Hyaloscypha bicolor E]
MLSTGDILTLVFGITATLIAIITIVVTVRLSNRPPRQQDAEVPRREQTTAGQDRLILSLIELGIL